MGDQNTILTMIPIFISVAVFFSVVFAVVAIVEGRHTPIKGGIIKQIYFYLVSILTLLISVAAVGLILQIVMKSTVFPSADTYDKASVSPPALYLMSAKTNTGQISSCTTGCEIDESQKSEIANWSTSYKTWQSSQDMSARRQRDLVAAISMLLVALPLFLIHFRVIQKESAQQTVEQRSFRVIRPTYFYIATFVGLGMMIAFGSLLINLILKTSLFPKANTVDNTNDAYNMAMSPETSSVTAIKSCATLCNLDAKYVATANQYELDYKNWQERGKSKGRNASEAAQDIAFLAVAIPLFWYHWTRVRKESHEPVAKKVVKKKSK